MISKNLIQALNAPWLIEQTAAEKLALIALGLLHNPTAVTDPVSQWANTESVPYTQDGVFVLPVNGPLMKNENCGSPGTANMIESLKQAIADPAIEAILLQIDSPGGTVDGTQVFADAIKASSKPVVAFVDGLMASAAMWIGSSASEIIASTNTDVVGSIGTMIQWPDFTGAYKRMGINLHTVTATASKDKNRVIADAAKTGDYTELQQTMLDPINDQFMGAVKKNRGDKLNLDNENVLTGKTYMAKDAIKHGLVDKIGTKESAIKRAKQLATIQKKNTMTTSKPGAFQKTLTVAKAESFAVVDNVGFGLSEENLTAIEEHIVATEGSVTSLTEQLATATAAIQTEKDACTTAEAALTATNTEKETLTAQLATANEKIVKLGGKPAVVKAVLVNEKIEESTAVDESKYLTSADIEKRKQVAKYGPTK